MKWNNDRKLRLIWNNIARLLRNDKIRDQSLFIAGGGGGVGVFLAEHGEI